VSETWSLATANLFEGSSAEAVLKGCEDAGRAYWKKHAVVEGDHVTLPKIAFIGGPEEALPEDFQRSWFENVMGLPWDRVKHSQLRLAVISNHHLRKIARKHWEKKP